MLYLDLYEQDILSEETNIAQMNKTLYGDYVLGKL
jgi:hypothetical protein